MSTAVDSEEFEQSGKELLDFLFDPGNGILAEHFEGSGGMDYVNHGVDSRLWVPGGLADKRQVSSMFFARRSVFARLELRVALSHKLYRLHRFGSLCNI